MKKIILIATLTIYSQIVFGQIKVPNVGDGWKPKVEAALEVIKTYDCEKYTELLNVCTQIEYWNGTFATTDVNSIIIPTSELKAGFINDIAAIIVHESLHLYFQKHNVKLSPRDEERLCYLYELEFLLKIPDAEPWLIEHAKKQIKLYSNE